MIKSFFMYLLDLFLIFGTASVTWLLFLGMKDRFFINLTLVILGISVFGSGWITMYETTNKASNYVNDKAEKFGKGIDEVNESIDKLGETVDGVKGTVDKVKENPVVKGAKKATDTLNKADKAIKDKGFKLREKITGQKVERLEE